MCMEICRISQLPPSALFSNRALRADRGTCRAHQGAQLHYSCIPHHGLVHILGEHTCGTFTLGFR